MPYINKDRRVEIMRGSSPKNAGELNFALTTVIDRKISQHGEIRYSYINSVIAALENVKVEIFLGHAGLLQNKFSARKRTLLNQAIQSVTHAYGVTCYQLGFKDREETIEDILGALEGAKLEFYRRIAVPYEDTKIEQNGDVYRCLTLLPH